MGKLEGRYWHRCLEVLSHGVEGIQQVWRGGNLKDGMSERSGLSRHNEALTLQPGLLLALPSKTKG